MMTFAANDLIVGPVVPASGTTLISIDYSVEDASWLEVYRGTADTLLVNGTDYTVAGAGGGVGAASITLTTAADGVDSYSILLNTPRARAKDLQLRGGFQSAPFNVEQDQIIQMIQYLSTLIDRSFQTSRTGVKSDPLEPVASAFLAFGADKKLTTTAVAPIGGATVSTFMEAVLDDLTAAAARATLGLAIGTDIPSLAAAAKLAVNETITADWLISGAPPNLDFSNTANALNEKRWRLKVHPTLGLRLETRNDDGTNPLAAYAISRDTLGPLLHKFTIQGTEAAVIEAAGTAAPTDPQAIITKEKLLAALVGIGIGWTFVEDTYDFAVDGAVASVESAAFADGYEYAFELDNLSRSTTSIVQLEIYLETGAAYHASKLSIAASTGAAVGEYGFHKLELSRITSSSKVVLKSGIADANTTPNDALSNAGEFTGHFELATAQKVGKVRIGASAGTFDGGKIIMYRRVV